MAITSQFKSNLHLAIAFSFCAFGFERAGGTGQALIYPAFGKEIIFRFIRLGFDIHHTVLGRTNEFVLCLVIRKVVGFETELLKQFGLARRMLFLMEGIVFEVVAHAQLEHAKPIIRAEGIKEGRRQEQERIYGELEDIRCSASGEYLPQIEILMKSLKKELES